MRRDREAGYVLFGIAIGLVILGISMTAAVPLWQKRKVSTSSTNFALECEP